jgi:predicted RNase H-like nuclease (RuvC/YqgF family)
VLKDVNSPTSDIKVCSQKLNDLLKNKYDAIHELKAKLDTFQLHLSQEKKLSNKFNEKQSKVQ